MGKIESCVGGPQCFEAVILLFVLNLPILSYYLLCVDVTKKQKIYSTVKTLESDFLKEVIILSE